MAKKKTGLSFLLIQILIVFMLFPPSAYGQSSVKMGILGDSTSDEYRANDNRGGSYSSVTFNWAEILQRFRGFDFGPWGSRSEPRRSGYEFNWARSGATTDSLISANQHTGLAQQISQGRVNHVVVSIGENDFHTWNGTYEEVYNGTMSNAQLQQKVNRMIGNITTAVNTVQAAGNVRVVVTTLADKSIDPSIVARFPDATKRQRVQNAINQVNTGIRQLADQKNIGLMDGDRMAQELFQRLDHATGKIKVGNQLIDMSRRGNEPHHFQLDDSVGHIGTVASGIFANGVMRAYNEAYGTSYQLFSDNELLAHAGIGSVPETPSPSPTPAPRVGDANGDGKVDGRDYTVWVTNFDKTISGGASVGDFNNSGKVDGVDYTFWLNNYDG